MTEVFKQIRSYGVRGLVYNGDVDMACNFIGTQKFVEDLAYKVRRYLSQTWLDQVSKMYQTPSEYKPCYS